MISEIDDSSANVVAVNTTERIAYFVLVRKLVNLAGNWVRHEDLGKGYYGLFDCFGRLIAEISINAVNQIWIKDHPQDKA